MIALTSSRTLDLAARLWKGSRPLQYPSKKIKKIHMATAFTSGLLPHGPDFIVCKKLPALDFIGFIQFICVES
jgi:hypothetical protein